MKQGSTTIAFGLAVAGLVVALITGIGDGSWIGAALALVGIPLAMRGIWQGMQQETQKQLAASIFALLFCLGIGALLIILKLVSMAKDAVT